MEDRFPQGPVKKQSGGYFYKQPDRLDTPRKWETPIREDGNLFPNLENRLPVRCRAADLRRSLRTAEVRLFPGTEPEF